MKRLLIGLIVMIMLFMSLPVAAETMDDIVYNEVSKLIDVKNYGVDESDDGIYLVALMESGYTGNGFSEDAALYVYLYNPSLKQVSSSLMSTIMLATAYDSDGKPTAFRNYPLQIEGSTLNGLYIRAKVPISYASFIYIKNGTRHYGVTEIELYEEGDYAVSSYKVGYVFKFLGTGDSLTCERESFLTITLDVGHTSYLTGDSALGAGYSNQIASVYFSIPEEIEERYGKLYSIDYEYYKYRTAPIMLYQDDMISLSQHGDPFWRNGYTVEHGKRVTNGVSSFYIWLDAPFGIVLSFPVDTYDPGSELVSGAMLKEAFLDYVSILAPTTNLVANKINGKYHKDCFDLSQYTENNYKVTEHKTRDDLFNMDSYDETHNWFEKISDFGLFYDKTAHDDKVKNAKYIEPITSAICSSSSFSSSYFVAEKDVTAVKSYVSQAEANGENAYLLRFAYTDNYKMLGGSNDYKYRLVDRQTEDTYEVVFIEQDVYLDFNIITLGFSDTGEDVTTFGVSMASIDIFPSIEGVQTTPDPFPIRDVTDPIKKIFAIVLVVVLCFAAIWLVRLFNQWEEARTNRAILREMRRWKK